MIFIQTNIPGAFIIEIELIADERGFFARTFCKREFEARSLETNFVQCSISYNRRKGTLRGMHYQISPYEETKIVSCIKGSIYDVVLDLRPDSDTFRQWVAVDLNDRNHRFLYIPKGCAHGFQTMEDDTEVYYQISEFYHPESARGIRWDDRAFSVFWPGPINVISAKDRNYPFFSQ
jgi:dTDP-4-dehydrorhamnose 3,5-epimerase